MLGKWPSPAKLPETHTLKVSALDPVIQVRILEGQLTVCGVAAPNWARRAGFSVATNEKAPQAKSLWGLIVTSHWMWGCWSADTTLA